MEGELTNANRIAAGAMPLPCPPAHPPNFESAPNTCPRLLHSVWSSVYPLLCPSKVDAGGRHTPPKRGSTTMESQDPALFQTAI